METESRGEDLPTNRFTVSKPGSTFAPPPIIIQYDPQPGTGYDWAQIRRAAGYPSPAGEGKLCDAVLYLQEAIQRLTGQEPLRIVSTNDLSAGIVLTTLQGSGPEIQHDREIVAALRNDGTDAYNDREAFYIRSEPNRLLIVANTADGLTAAVPELLESVGYEVLGMGPNWTHVPTQFRETGLAFQIRRTGRPSFYGRRLALTSGQERGIGTVTEQLKPKHPDETVDVSFRRWLVGTRGRGQSMPPLPGHALQNYHAPVLEHMQRTGTNVGFIASTSFGLDRDRPSTAPAENGCLWINTDATGTAAAGKVYYSDAAQWLQAWPNHHGCVLRASIDLSADYVRQLVLQDLIAAAERAFSKDANAVFHFGTDPEDGGYPYGTLPAHLAHPNWYPETLGRSPENLGSGYRLHKYLGLDQPNQLWDAAAPSDHVFGFNNWLLHEYDKHIAAQPPGAQKTTSGLWKTNQVRTCLYSYNFHDVPPNFDVDPRILVSVASYPKHRGFGKWTNYFGQVVIAGAFKQLIPSQPSSDYTYLSQWPGEDTIDVLNPFNQPMRFDVSPRAITKRIKESYSAGIRHWTAEMDFNFGRNGLGYYLLMKSLWDTRLSVAQLDELRMRWLQRAFGTGWPKMKEYHDLFSVDQFPVNGPTTWARAIQFIDEADQLIDESREPDAQARIDDVKQLWYYYYLLESGEGHPDSAAMREFIWKGQMAYMVPMLTISSKIFHDGDFLFRMPQRFLPDSMRAQPAHYSRGETDAWWAKVKAHWPVTPLQHFADSTLINGVKAATVDVNDLVRVTTFTNWPASYPYQYDGYGRGDRPTPLVVANAGEIIGFNLIWPILNAHEPRFFPCEVRYGVESWDATAKRWQTEIDLNSTAPGTERNDVIRITQLPANGRGVISTKFSTEHYMNNGTANVARVRWAAPRKGTYRFHVGQSGAPAYLAGAAFDLNQPLTPTNQSRGLVYTSVADAIRPPGGMQVFVYIPKGTRSLDLEVWDTTNSQTVELYAGVTGPAAAPSRTVSVGKRGLHRIPLLPGEDGSLARIMGDTSGFTVPYFYSVPMIWAKTPSELLIPRAIARADGLGVKE